MFVKSVDSKSVHAHCHTSIFLVDEACHISCYYAVFSIILVKHQHLETKYCTNMVS